MRPGWSGLALALLGAGCGAGPAGMPVVPDAGDGFAELIGADWSLSSGSEAYQCTRITLTRDTWVGAFRGIEPPGTHHTVVSLAPSGADGTYPCDGAANGPALVFGTGLGTPEFDYPAGVAVKLPAGQQLVLNLHLFNATASPVSGHSGVAVRSVDAATVVHEAEAVLAGKDGGLVVAPGASTQAGRCSMAADVTLFGVFPHMHQLGTHMKITAQPSGGAPVVLSDRDYQFGNQVIYPIGPALTMRSGDPVIVECTYDNTTGATVRFGQSSKDEMCYAGLYRYPKVAKALTCTN